MGVEIKSAGSMTLKRRDIQRGIEPDNCYFIQSLPALSNQGTLNLESDPPPDLAIEIDITSSSVDKLGIYAALGVSEIWQYNGKTLKFYHLLEGNYLENQYSLAFPILFVAEIENFLEQSKTLGEIALVKAFRAWVKAKI